MASGVLFDLFGTLIVSRPNATIVGGVSQSLARSFERLGLDLAGIDPTTLENDVWEVELLPEEAGATPFELRLASFVFRRLGVRLAAPEFRRAADDACAEFQSARMLDPVAAEVIAQISRTNIVGLVTNYDHPPHIHSILLTTGLRPLMRDVVISGEVNLWKPDPAILHLACSRLGLREAETIYAGDSIVDYQAASGAGLRFAWIHRTDREDRAEEAEIRNSFAESDEMLRGLAQTGEILLVGHLEDLGSVTDRGDRHI